MKIGRLSKVDPRALWASEAFAFTPWLAKEENIELLGETIGIELEVISEERNVGPFRADILCKSTIDDTFVLVENQLEKTDHTHLGQLMTYAAGLEAVTIVWIAKRFTEEHRAALDWLNRVTDEKLRFFGIELEVFKIGDSIPAPMFQLVSKPNDWTKAIQSAQKQGELTETKALNLEYWTALKKYIESHGSSLNCQKPPAQHWTNFAAGRSYFHYSAVASARDNFIRVGLNLQGNNATQHFHSLKNNFEEQSFSEISPDLDWDELEDRKQSYISLQISANILDRQQWEKQFAWFKDTLEKFDLFFRTKIKNLP